MRLSEYLSNPNQITHLKAQISQMREALQWCSGSEDFGPVGKARVGWQKMVKPLLDCPGVVWDHIHPKSEEPLTEQASEKSSDEENMSLHVREVLLDIIKCTKPDAEYLHTPETLAYISWWANEALGLTPIPIADWVKQSALHSKSVAKQVAVAALEKLSGDLSYDKVAAAKRILKQIIE